MGYPRVGWPYARGAWAVHGTTVVRMRSCSWRGSSATSAAVLACLVLTGACGAVAETPIRAPTNSVPLIRTPTAAPTGTSTPRPTLVPTLGTPAVPFTIHLIAGAVGNDGIQLEGMTNLPPGSILMITASRAFRNVDEADIREAPAVDSDLTLEDGTFSLTLTLDESILPLGVDETYPIEVVSSAVDVCVKFATGVDNDGQQRQTGPSVIAAVGASGEGLRNSPQVKVFGSATDHPANWLEAATTVRMSSLMLDQVTAQQGFEPDVQLLTGFCL